MSTSDGFESDPSGQEQRPFGSGQGSWQKKSRSAGGQKSGPQGFGSRGSGSQGFGSRRSGSQRSQTPGDEPMDPALDGPSDPESVARTIVLDKLSVKARTRSELADALAARDIPDEVAAKVLDRFGEVGLIDDAAFASAWVESRHRSRGLASRALAQELRRKGVDDELARDALGELEPEQEADTARALVRRKLPSMRNLERQVAMRRLLGMLARKGYPGGVAMSIIKEEMAASDEELPLLNDSGLEAE